MADDVVVPAVPVIPPAPASDAPPEHHASWLMNALHVLGKVEHCGVKILESEVVMAFVPPEVKPLVAIIAVADAVIRGDTAPSEPTAAPQPTSSTPTGA